MRELNIELEESHVQTEHDLREEVDLADSKIREVKCFVSKIKHLIFIIQYYVEFEVEYKFKIVDSKFFYRF